MPDQPKCLIPDFPGDTCEFWVKTYQQQPCAACKEYLRAKGEIDPST